MIHATAVIHPQARVDATVAIGAYAVIDAGVTLGAECVVGPHVHLTGHTTIGAKNIFHAGSVIGDAPQDLKYNGEPTSLRIGDGNVFRECVTVNRSNKPEEDTVIGSNCYLMATSHVGHNSVVGDRVIIANGTSLGGHVTVGDRAFISGNCLIHQFVRVGPLALMQGGAAISKDLPPFTIARGPNGICGLNIVGLRRAGFSAAERLELKQIYNLLFRSRRHFRDAIAAVQQEFSSAPTKTMLEFLTASKRGVCADTSAGGAVAAED